MLVCVVLGPSKKLPAAKTPHARELICQPTDRDIAASAPRIDELVYDISLGFPGPDG